MTVFLTFIMAAFFTGIFLGKKDLQWSVWIIVGLTMVVGVMYYIFDKT